VLAPTLTLAALREREPSGATRPQAGTGPSPGDVSRGHTMPQVSTSDVEDRVDLGGIEILQQEARVARR
jgi:hypothetical protein